MSLTPSQMEDMQFLRETMRWPHWPWCPVTRNGETASCFDEDGGKRVVFKINLFIALEQGLKGVEKIEYENSYAMLKDGWIVD